MVSPASSSKPTGAAEKAAGASVSTRLVRIGNSRGIRIPKSILEQAGLANEEEVDLIIQGRELILRKRRTRRAGWRESIRAALEKHGHDVDDDFLGLPNDFSEKEWTWPQDNSTSTSSRSTRRQTRK